MGGQDILLLQKAFGYLTSLILMVNYKIVFQPASSPKLSDHHYQVIVLLETLNFLSTMNGLPIF